MNIKDAAFTVSEKSINKLDIKRHPPCILYVSFEQGDDDVMSKGTEVVMHLIKLCEELKAVAESEADKRSWVEIFTDVGDVCVDTLAQIEADKSGSGSGEPEKRRVSVSVIHFYAQ